MKIIKPQHLALLTRPFENDGQAYLVITAMGFFPFSEPRKLLHEVALWKMAAAELGKDAMLDGAMSKRRGEVLVAGSAFALGGAATTATSVRVQMAGVDKQLYVIGDRQWKTTGPTDAVPFKSMAVTWGNAFGGEGFAKNPAGKGIKPVELDGKAIHPLPNVEDPRHLVKSPRDKPEPAGFGPLDVTSPLRMEKVGTYDQEWLRTRFPGFAKDFDWEFFNVAPPDQRIDGYFKLDEKFRVEGMHPSARVVEGSLPGATARLFIVRTVDGRDEWTEATSRLDTVYLFPSIERGVVVFRGMLPIADDDGADVKVVVAAFEDPAAPRDLAHYQRVLAARTDKKRGALAAMIDADLLPPWKVDGQKVPEDDWNEVSKHVETEDLRLAFGQRKAAHELGEARAKVVAAGLDPEEFDRRVAKAPEPPPKDPAAVPDYLDRMEVMLAEARREADARKEEQLAKARADFAAKGVDFDKAMEDRKKGGGGPPTFRAAAEIEKLEDMAQLGRNAGVDTSELDAKLADREFRKKLDDTERQVLDLYRRFAHAYPEAASLEGEASQRVRAAVIAARAKGESLARRDLTGADLSGLDLSGVDLGEALLEKVDLSSTNLRGAKLRGAVLVRTKLGGADLEGANLAGANLGQADARGARLAGADLTETSFHQTDLREATLHGVKLHKTKLHEARLAGVDLSGAELQGVTFLDADLTGAKFAGARFDTVIFLRCQLGGASFTSAAVPKTSFVECQAEKASFVDATMERTGFAMATNLAGADLRGARMKHTVFRGANLAEADLSGATADDCDFSEADLSRAKLYRTSAQRSLFVRTNLQGADLRSARLLYAILQKAKLHGADLRGANLFRADLAKVRADKTTNFKDAYLIQIRVVPDKTEPKVIP